jgi:hypothetical protein
MIAERPLRRWTQRLKIKSERSPWRQAAAREAG